MNLLALDTSTEFCSLAVARAGQVFERHFHAGQRHSEMALPVLAELLSQAGLGIGEIEGVVFGAGPGSFTGLRIACGIAQGLAAARDLPVVGVGTLLALAEDAGAAGVIACLDARMGEVYHAVYRKQGENWMELHAPALYKPGSVPPVEGGDWVGCGSGFLAHGPALMRCYGDNLARTDAAATPRAAAMLRLALPVFAAGGARDAAQAAPLYVRNKVALKMSER